MTEAVGEVLVVEGRDDRYSLNNFFTSNNNSESDKLLMETNDFLLLETGDKILINSVRASVVISEGYLSPESDIGYGRQIINRVKTSIYPREVDTSATSTLWQLQEEFWMAPGTLTGINGSYHDPSGKTKINGSDMVTPVAGTHYTAGTSSGGTSATGSLTVTPAYGSDSVEYTLINAAAGSICVTMLKAVGKGIYLNDPAVNIKNDTASQAQYGMFSADIDMRYQNDPSAGDYVARTILTNFSSPVLSLDRGVFVVNRNGLSMYAFLQLEPGRKAYFQESNNNLDTSTHVVNGYDAEISNGLATWYPVLKKIEQFP